MEIVLPGIGPHVEKKKNLYSIAAGCCGEQFSTTDLPYVSIHVCNITHKQSVATTSSY